MKGFPITVKAPRGPRLRKHVNRSEEELKAQSEWVERAIKALSSGVRKPAVRFEPIDDKAKPTVED